MRKFKVKSLKLKVSKGFTLVELLLYLGIFTILLAALVQMFASLLNTQLESNATSSVSIDSRYILARLSYDLSQAQNISSPILGASGSALQFVVNNTNYTYALSGNNLILTNSNGTDQLNSSEASISNLSFTPIGSISGKFTVQVNFTLASTTIRQGGKPQTQVIQTTLGNR